MQKFIISVKEKNTGRDVISPYIVNSLDGLGAIVSGSGNAVGTYNRAFPLKPISVKGFGR
jgi:hypothetical protein